MAFRSSKAIPVSARDEALQHDKDEAHDYRVGGGDYKTLRRTPRALKHDRDDAHHERGGYQRDPVRTTRE